MHKITNELLDNLLEVMKERLSPYFGEICTHNWLYDESPFVLLGVEYEEGRVEYIPFYVNILIIGTAEKTKRVVAIAREEADYDSIIKNFRIFASDIKICSMDMGLTPI